MRYLAIVVAVASLVLAAPGCEPENTEELQSLRQQVQTLEQERDRLAAREDELQEQVDRLQGQVDDLSGAADRLEEQARQIEELRASLAEARRTQQQEPPDEEPATTEEPTQETIDPQTVERVRARMLELGRRLFEDDRHELALSLLRSAHDLGAESPELLYRIAYGYARTGHPEDALEWYERARAAFEDTADVEPGLRARLLNNYGVTLLAAEQPQEALQAFQAALEADPELTPAHFNVALAHRALPDGTDAAVESLRRYIAAGGERSASARRMIQDLLEADSAPVDSPEAGQPPQ